MSNIQMVSSDGDEIGLTTGEPSARKSWVKAGGVVAALALLAVGVATFRSVGTNSESLDFEEKAEFMVVPPRDSCSDVKDNCMQTKCCKTTNYQCFQIDASRAQCMDKDKGCHKGMCAPLMAMQPPSQPKGLRLFCWTMYVSNTGSTKKSYQLDLIRTQLHVGASLFGCKGWAVYGDTRVQISPGPPELYTTEVSIPQDAYFAKRKTMGTWVNSMIFFEAWKKMKVQGDYKNYDWVVKVDTDAVFLPARLLNRLRDQPVSDQGIYMENCKKVMYGFFGNLEVASIKAWTTFLENLDDCKSTLDYKGNNWKFGPWGEDLFAQKCMDLHGVNKVWAFDLTTDGACEATRPEGEKKNKKWKPDCGSSRTPAMHPFKKPADYFNCLLATQR